MTGTDESPHLFRYAELRSTKESFSLYLKATYPAETASCI